MIYSNPAYIFFDQDKKETLETLDEEIYNNNTFNNLEVIYKKEIKLHEKINCYYSFENDGTVTLQPDDASDVLTATDLPEPVEPAISRCGALARSSTTG